VDLKANKEGDINMKKNKEETKRFIYVMRNNEPDTTYGGNEVIAVDSKEKLEIYKQQFINNNL